MILRPRAGILTRILCAVSVRGSCRIFPFIRRRKSAIDKISNAKTATVLSNRVFETP